MTSKRFNILLIAVLGGSVVLAGWLGVQKRRTCKVRTDMTLKTGTNSIVQLQNELKKEANATQAGLSETTNVAAGEPQTKAEKLYHTASAMKETGDSAYTSNRIIIACCRQLLEEYPNSPQAEKAKELLKDVPEEFLKRYDEEMSFLRPKEPKVKKSKRLRRRAPQLPREQHDITIEETAD